MTASIPLPEPLDQGLSQAAAILAATPGGVLSLTEKCLTRIAALDEALGCMVQLDVDGALVRAAELDQVSGTAQHGPLHGIPIVIKEIFSVDGYPDSNGSRLATPELFAAESSLVGRLRAAGCVVLGRTLSTEFALGQFNISKRMPINPRDTEVARVTGGSSSGSAAAVATDYCGFALGTDTGGSVRAPAAFCGVTGFKPSAGVWPTDGIFPLSARLDCPGVFTRTAADAAYIYNLLTGGADDAGRPGSRRIGIPEEFFFADCDAGVAAAVEQALKNIAAAGYELVPLTLPSMEPVAHYYATALTGELLRTIGGERYQAGREMLDPLTRTRLDAAAEIADQPGVSELDRLIEATERCLAEADVSVWLSPTVPCVAPPEAELGDPDAVVAFQARASRNTRCISALNMAAISLPLPANLPVGLQLAAPAGNEAMVLQVASELEACL